MSKGLPGSLSSWSARGRSDKGRSINSGAVNLICRKLGWFICHSFFIHLLYSQFAALFLLPGPIPTVRPVWNVSDLLDPVTSCAKVFTCWFYCTRLTTRSNNTRQSVFWNAKLQYVTLHKHITEKSTKISILSRQFANSEVSSNTKEYLTDSKGYVRHSCDLSAGEVIWEHNRIVWKGICLTLFHHSN